MAKFVKRVPYIRNDGRNVSRSIYKCVCGAEILCGTNTNACECGRYYNMSGQELLPPEEWEPQDYYDEFGPQNGKDPDEVG